MATFNPPISGATAMSAPIRAMLDDSGHRTALIARFTGPNVRALAPCRVFAKPIAVAGPFAGAAPAGERFWFAELSPLLRGASAPVLRELAQNGTTMPRFFIGGPGIDEAALNGTYEQDASLATGTELFMGATLGTCALAHREWTRSLVEAMTGEAGLDGWSAFANLLGEAGPALYVLNHVGQVPAADEMSFEVAVGGGAPVNISMDERGDLQAVSPASLSLFDPGVRIRLVTGAGGIPFHTAYRPGTRSSAEPNASDDERWFAPAALADSGTILCTDLNGWYGVRPPEINLPRYHIGNRAIGLLDGQETFENLRRDLDRLLTGDVPANANTYGTWLASWAFKNFRLRRDGAEPEPLFVDLVKALNDSPNVSVRLLATKLVNFDGSETDEERRLMLLALCIATLGLDNLALPVARLIGKGVSFEAGLIMKASAILLILATHPLFVDKITDLLDGSKDVLEALTPPDAQTPRFALWSRYPAQFSDNPAASAGAGDLLNALVKLKRIGVWHSKMQLVAAPAAGGAVEYVGYLGGIDINDNRTESWGHRWVSDYHDIHARVTGPAVADLFQSFYERYAHEEDHRLPEDGPAAPNTCPCVVPRPGDVTAKLLGPIAPAGDDIVQIARTIYRPSAANAAEAFWFAPNGEASVHDSILRAIHSAREYIYIEDQFMAPPDSGGAGDEILEALVGAAERCKALIMVFPEGTGDKQWMFGVERRNWLMARLSEAWGQQAHRRFLPLIHARPLLDRTGPVASFRRTVLKDAISAVATQIRVVDGKRVPPAPCWAWISGELLLVNQVDVDTLSGAASLSVERGTQGRHLNDSWARDHAAGAPVTFARFDDVFIHAKMMLVDDVYASIGSTNMSRRSMYHDGEISAQIVPGQLRAAATNPVRDLRCRVWADHLGIPPEVALAALSDPLEALPLFERTRAAGNTLVPYLLLDDMKPQGAAIETANAVQILGTIFGGLGQLGGDLVRRIIYSTIVDPTTSLDPFHDADPFTGP